MSFYNSRQSKVFAQRFTLVKSDNEVAHNIDFSCAHPINQDNKSVFYDKNKMR